MCVTGQVRLAGVLDPSPSTPYKHTLKTAKLQVESCASLPYRPLLSIVRCGPPMCCLGNSDGVLGVKHRPGENGAWSGQLSSDCREPAGSEKWHPGLSPRASHTKVSFKDTRPQGCHQPSAICPWYLIPPRLSTFPDLKLKCIILFHEDRSF